MRFILAIAAFVAAAVLVTLGFAQRTVWLGADTVTASASDIESEASLLVIDGSVLNTLEGRQTVSLEGEGTLFAAYGRTTDVMAWVGESSYETLTIDPETGELVTTFVEGADAEPVPSPAGSDLWLNEYSQEGVLTASFTLPASNTVLIASDGSASPVGQVSISWPQDNSTPWSTPLIVLGALLLLVSLLLYLNALLHLRKTRGPRRRNPKLPKPPKPGSGARKALPATAQKAITPPKGRRSGRRRMVVALPVLLIGAIGLSACAPGSTANTSPLLAAVTSSTDEPEGEETAAPQAAPVVASVSQVEKIIGRVVAVADAADASLDSTTLATRFSGAALELRTASYTMRSRDGNIAAEPSIPDGPPVFTLPQQTETWPRTVMTVVQEGEGTEIRQVLLVLVQATPRENYTVRYAIDLKSSLPEVASAQSGAGRLENDSTLLKVAPTTLAVDYADVLANGEASAFYALFNAEGDTLQSSYGAAYKAARAGAPGDGAAVAFSSTPNPTPAVALSTTDSGAIVAVSLTEQETVTPTASGNQVRTDGEVAQLLGGRTSTKGIEASYGYQLLFYVPISGSEDQIQLLGFTQGLVGAREVG